MSGDVRTAVCTTCGDVECPGAPRFKGVCPLYRQAVPAPVSAELFQRVKDERDTLDRRHARLCEEVAALRSELLDAYRKLAKALAEVKP